MNIALGLIKTDKPIRCQGRVEDASRSMHEFQVAGGGVPRVKQHGTRCESLIGNGSDQQVAQVVILGFAVGIRRIDAVVNGVEIACGTVTMDQGDYTNSSNNAVVVAAVLAFDQFNLAGIAFVVHAVVEEQQGRR